jgi:hypothetical protein
MTTAEATLRDRMIRNAIAYNKSLTSDYLNKRESETILCFTHVTDRKDFQFELNKIREAENVNL